MNEYVKRSDIKEVVDSAVGDILKAVNFTPGADVIVIGETYSSNDFKIITEYEGDHQLFRVERRK